jgi:hypothetical protein
MQTWAGRRTAWAMAAVLVGIHADVRAQGQDKLEPKDGLVCMLVNVNSGRCLSVEDQSPDAGAKMVQGPTPDKAGRSEHWKLIETGPAFRLRNEKSGLVLQVWSSNRQNGSRPVQAKDEVTKDHQHWTFEPKGEAYVVRVAHSQLVLGVAASARDEGARVVQWNYVPDVADQLWVLRPPGDIRPVSAAGDAPADKPGGPRGRRPVAVIIALVSFAVLALGLLWALARRGVRAAGGAQGAETGSPNG